MKHIFANIAKIVPVNLNWTYISCVLDGQTTMNKLSAPRKIRYSMLKHEKQIY